MPEDAVAFFRYDTTLSPRVQRNPGIPTWFWLILVGMIVLVGVAVKLMLRQSFSFGILEGLLLFSMAWCLFFFFFGKRLVVYFSLRKARRDRYLFGKKTMTVSADGLSVQGDSGTTTRHWHAVRWITEHGEHAFFYFTEKAAVILPKRAFADARQSEEFLATARRYHAEAHRFTRPEGPA
jgi:hypothetical protein